MTQLVLIVIAFAVIILAYCISIRNKYYRDYIRNREERRKYQYEASHRNLYAPVPDCECRSCKRFGTHINPQI